VGGERVRRACICRSFWRDLLGQVRRWRHTATIARQTGGRGQCSRNQPSRPGAHWRPISRPPDAGSFGMCARAMACRGRQWLGIVQCQVDTPAACVACRFADDRRCRAGSWCAVGRFVSGTAFDFNPVDDIRAGVCLMADKLQLNRAGAAIVDQSF